MQTSAVRFELFDMIRFEYRKVNADPAPQQQTRVKSVDPNQAGHPGEILDLASNGRAWSLKTSVPDNGRMASGGRQSSDHCLAYTAKGSSIPLFTPDPGGLINVYA